MLDEYENSDGQMSLSSLGSTRAGWRFRKTIVIYP